MTMNLLNAAVGKPLLATDMVQIFHHINQGNGAAAFGAVGTTSWQVPNGVHKFQVILCGGGGGGFTTTNEFGTTEVSGLDGTCVTTWFTGVEIGTTFLVTVGAGGVGDNPGSPSQFGPSFIAPGGRSGSQSLTLPSKAPASFPAGTSPQLYVDHGVMYGTNIFKYGAGRIGNGIEGLCLIFW